MIHRRGVLPVLVLLVLVLAGGVLQVARGPAAASTDSRPAATPTPTPAQTAAAQAVLRSLTAVERAYDAGNVRALCRPSALLDSAVVRAQGRRCESGLESLMANVPRLRVAVRGVAIRPDLATVATGTGAVDFVRRGRRWLMSFSQGQAPLPVLAGSP
jgi:hypothetical protein